ncbi:MAG: thymidylate synthase [Candidatus Nealsonbacteria bacterium]
MKYIKKETIGASWLKAVEVVMEEGNDFYDRDVKIKELLDLFIEIKDALLIDDVIKKHGDKYMIEQLKIVLLDTKPGEWGWSYGQRLFGDSNYFNQIEFIVNKLKRKPETKSATVTCLFPKEDFQKGAHIPCICLLDFKIRDNRLNMSVCLRSQDIAKKMYGDALALGKLMEKVANELDVLTGNLKLYIMSAHIYENEFEKMRKIIGNS